MADYNNNVTLERVRIANLVPDSDNTLLVAIIIAKQRARKLSSKSNNLLPLRAVWNFTIRDSPRDYINVTYWDSMEKLFQIQDQFKTGDVVEIQRPAVLIRRINDYGEQFRPLVTSPFSLSLGEQSSIKLHSGNATLYLGLLRLPTKPLSGFVAMRDIHNLGASMKDVSVDILGAIRTVGTVRNVTTKSGDVCQVREVILFDYTSAGLKLTIWEPDVIARASDWKSRATILFISDVKVEWSNFQRSYFVTLSNRSIVTENPAGVQAASLSEYAKKAPLEASAIADSLVNSLIDPQSIQNVMNILQLRKKVASFIEENHSGDHKFTALLYAFVTELDLDGLTPTTKKKCAYCKTWMDKLAVTCENGECPSVKGDAPLNVEEAFDLRVSLTDHTGTLCNCRLTGSTAEAVLGCSVQDFLMLTDDQKCALKWKFLMERCAVRIMVLLINRRNPVITIVSCSLNIKEMAEKISIF